MPGSLLSFPRATLALGLVLAVAACAPGGAYRPAPGFPQVGQTLPQQPVDTARPVRIALLVPLSGANEGAASAGRAIANAAQMAETDLAEPGLEVKVYDTGGSPEIAGEMAHRAVAEGAALILGPLFGANTPIVGDVATQAGINVISFSTDTAVAGGPVFVSGYLPESEARRVIGYAAAQGHDRVAVFYPDTAYGSAALRGAEEAAHVVTAVGYVQTFQGIQESAGEFAAAALDVGANAVLLPDGGQALRSVGAFMDYGGLDPITVKYLGLGQWNNAATLQEPALQGGWFSGPDPDRLDFFANLYASRYGSRPPFIAVLGYDAVQVAGQLLSDARRLGSRTPFGRSELTRPEGFQGALGLLRFEPDGTNERAMAILEVGIGSFQVIDPAPVRFGYGS